MPVGEDVLFSEVRVGADDRVRQLVLTSMGVLNAISIAFSSGLIGGLEPMRRGGGPLSPALTVYSPAPPVFLGYLAMYLLLGAFLIWQWLPAQAHDPRLRSIAWPAICALALNAIWLPLARAELLDLGAVVALLVCLALGVLVVRLAKVPPRSAVERVVVDGAFGFYFALATSTLAAGVSAAVLLTGWRPGPALRLGVAGAVLLATVLGAFLMVRLTRNAVIAVGFAWGTFWWGVARLTGPVYAVGLGVAAVAATVIILATPLLARQFPRASSAR